MRKKEIQQGRNLTQSLLNLTILSLVMTSQTLAQNQNFFTGLGDEIMPVLYGIGLMGRETAEGVSGLSFEGGAELMIYGSQLAHYPRDNVVKMKSSNPQFVRHAPQLTDADVFHSNTVFGNLAYTTPGIDDLTGLSMPNFGSFDSISTDASVLTMAPSTDVWIWDLTCPSKTASFCRLVYSRSYTPVIYYLTSPVVYYGMTTQLYVNPQNAQDGLRRVGIDMPFIEATIDKTHIDFGERYDKDSQLSKWSTNLITGKVGNQKPNANSDFQMKWISGYTQHADYSMKICAYNSNTDCYKTKTVPLIVSVDQHSGSIAGGQILKIRGYGLTGPNENSVTEVRVDNVACHIIDILPIPQTEYEEITCITGKKPTASNSNTPQPGAHGLKNKYCAKKDKTSISLAELDSPDPAVFNCNTTILTSFETIRDQDDYYGQVVTGYFKAPVTGSYTFYIAGDDANELSMSVSALSSESLDPAKRSVLASSSYTGYRDYWKYSTFSTVSLVAGEYYYIQAKHQEGAGGDYLTVGVKFDGTTTNHPNSIKEVQRLRINQDNLKDTTKVTLTGFANGDVEYTLTFDDPNPASTYTFTTGLLKVSAGAWTFMSAVNDFYQRVYGSEITVTRKYFDSLNNDITATTPSFTANVKKVEYTITVIKQIKVESCTSITASGSLTVQVTYPSALQLSSAPLAGKFIIKWPATTNCNTVETTQTGDIAWNARPWDIHTMIYTKCRDLRDIDIWDNTDVISYYEEGRDIMIRFKAFAYGIDQWTIMDTTTAGESIALNSVRFSGYQSTTEQEYSNTLMYEPIPYEFLYTNQMNPQVDVTVDNLQAVCQDNCDYSYVDLSSSSQITGVSPILPSQQSLTITGTGLPTSAQDITIHFSTINCTSITTGATQITCTLDAFPVTGSWWPEVRTANGFIQVLNSVAKIEIPISITSVSGISALNPNGNQLLTITGTNFPQTKNEFNQISITFSAQGTECDVQSVSTTQITCLTRSLAGQPTTQTMTININGKTDSTRTVTLDTTISGVASINPQSPSPVLKQNLVITLDAGFPQTLNRADFKVQLKDSNGNLKELRVKSVDDGLKQLTVVFGGALQGTYDVLVTHSVQGKLTNTHQLIVKSSVTSISPSSGSTQGGNLVTIQGTGFSALNTDMNVFIGNTECVVITTASTQLTCRLKKPDTVIATGTAETVRVFLKAAEQAKCEDGNSCAFTLNDPTATITGYSLTYSQSTGLYSVTVNGNNLPTNLADIDLQLDGVSQTISSPTTTSFISTATGILSQSPLVNLFLAEGKPNGHVLIETMTFLPKVFKVEPNLITVAGATILVTVPGVGLESDAKVVDANGVSICSDQSIVGPALIQCKTNVPLLSSVNPVNVKVKVTRSGTTTSYGCDNSLGSSACRLSTDNSLPEITSIQTTGNVLTFTGTNLQVVGAVSVKARLGGVNADSASTNIISATQATASWNTLGLPLGTGLKVELVYILQTDPEKSMIAKSVTYDSTAPLVALSSASNSAVSCSYSGGCSLTITNAPGLGSSLQDSNSKITICKETCSVVSVTSNSVTCTIPEMPTIYAADTFKLRTQKTIYGKLIGSDLIKAATLFDGMNPAGWVGSLANCYFGQEYPEGQVGEVSRVHFFMNRFDDNSVFANNLKVQGSNDLINWIDLHTVDISIHEKWNDIKFATPQKYKAFRMFGSTAGSCDIGEARFFGRIVKDYTGDTQTCIPEIIINSNAVSGLSSLQAVTYTNANTPFLTSINPRHGNVKGGTTVTFNGQNFPTSGSTTIKIDGVLCGSVTLVSASVMTCVTAARPGKPTDYPTTTLTINSAKGNFATQGILYRYASLWNDVDTWGGDFEPLQGESIHIPAGMNLLVNVDSTPLLNAVIVEGSLLFPSNPSPTHLRTFDARYVFVNKGLLEIGTENDPYTSKLQITMHGVKSSPEIPIYGNKVIAVREGTLDIHGIPRTLTWTSLATTAEIGDTTITLQESVDWQVGEVIVIAPTGYSNEETEKVTIKRRNSATSFDIEPALAFRHYAATETYGTDTIEMRAEVGLLTRNVVFRGEPVSSQRDQFGAHIMLHSSGDESLTGRIEYAEFTDVGQAFQLGRYPIHFHMIGTVQNSYIKGNAIHQTYNRACTLHGVHYLTIKDNVAYNTMGHTFFVEDAAETKNLLDHNLALLTRRSMSLLNTDQSPASFWITHPDNYLRNNHAAGSDRYGFWYDLQDTSIGPSFDPNICPVNAQLGEFKNNVAHSNGRYGLRIFHGLVPRSISCQPINSVTNPSVTAVFEDYTGYKNQRNGAIFETVGDVRVRNFKTADNILAGIEFSLTDQTPDGTAQIESALVIGYSQGNVDAIQRGLDIGPHGVITPRTENFQVNNVKFFNFNQSDAAALGSCSHCFHPASTDSGARTVKFSNLQFNGVTKKIRYQFPWRAIYLDTDSTLTNLGANSWATPYWKHNDWASTNECLNSTELDGLICKPTVQVRRVAFWNWKTQIFEGMEMKIAQWDDTIINPIIAAGNIETYKNDDNNYSIVPFKPKLKPSNGWAMPYVTGHKYKIHWKNGLDFEQMQMDLSERWSTSDKDVYFIFNHTDVRSKVEFRNVADNLVIDNYTLVTVPQANYQTGDNWVKNHTDTRQIHTVVNGKNSSRSSIKMIGFRCHANCGPQTYQADLEDSPRYWSNPAHWSDNRMAGEITVPLVGEEREIKPSWNMIYDLPASEAVVLKMLTVNGILTFDDSADRVLKAEHIFVKYGSIIVGNNETDRFQHKADIILYGEQESETIFWTNAIEAGNKVIANTGTIRMYGKEITNHRTVLLRPAYPGDTSIYVETTLGWNAGDKILLEPTGLLFKHSEYVEITSYNPTTGVIVLKNPLQNYHYGAAQSTGTGGAYGGIDMRGRVYHMTRNVRIMGDTSSVKGKGWGCQIVTSPHTYEVGTKNTPSYVEYQTKGELFLDHVEIYNCSQQDTYKAALRFESAELSVSMVSNSVIHHGLGRGLQVLKSAKISLINNVFYYFSPIGINIQTSKSITLDSNAVLHITPRVMLAMDAFNDPSGAFVICGFNDPDKCSDLVIVNNIAAGSEYAGFGAPGHDCGGEASQNSFRDNIAHSINGYGGIFFPSASNPGHSTCWEASHFQAYKCTEEGALTYYVGTEVRFSNMQLVDNGYSVNIMKAGESDLSKIKLSNLNIYGETEVPDCPKDSAGKVISGQCKCQDKHAMLLSYFTKAGKPPFPRSKILLPIRKIKSDSTFGGVTEYENLKFIGFKSNTTACGRSQSVFVMNPFGADYVPQHIFKNTEFREVHENAFAKFMDPPLAWANLDDCGNFPCTAPLNAELFFQRTTFTYPAGGPVAEPSFAGIQLNFQMLGNNSKAADAFPSCKYNPTWNGYICKDNEIGLLYFDSLDADTMDRTVSPIVVTSPYDTPKFSNLLNSFMDHIWDGFYTGQKRMSRFPSIVKGGYTIQLQYTGTPPSNQKFKYLSPEGSGIVVEIKYPKADSYRVLSYPGNQVMTQREWNDALQAPNPLQKSGCGEFRFVGIVNLLQFYMTAGCTVIVQKIDAIQSSLRLSWTLADFYAAGGTSSFADRLASSLGIHPSTIKVVTAYEGSVIVVFQITSTTNSKTELQQIESTLKTKIQAGTLNVGAEILDATVTDVPVDFGGNTNNGNGTSNNETNNSTSGGNNNGTNPIIYNNGTETETESKAGSIDMKKLAIIIGVICGVFLIFAIVATILYRKLKKQESQRVVKTKPGQEEEEDEHYSPQHHPDVNIDDIFKDDKKQGKKVNNADHIEEESIRDGVGTEPEHAVDEVQGRSMMQYGEGNPLTNQSVLASKPK